MGDRTLLYVFLGIAWVAATLAVLAWAPEGVDLPVALVSLGLAVAVVGWLARLGARDFFAQNPGWSLEGRGAWVVAYRDPDFAGLTGRPPYAVRPDELPELLAALDEVEELIRDRIPGARPH